MAKAICVWCGVSKKEQHGCRLPTLQVIRLFQRWPPAGHRMVRHGPGHTLGSPWPPLPIRPWQEVSTLHRLPKVSPGPAMPAPSILCGWVLPETALWLVLKWPAYRVSGLQPSSTPLDTPPSTGLIPGLVAIKPVQATRMAARLGV
jgi:hypothetical protein